MSGDNMIASQIERLIARLDGAAICDDCIADRLDLAARSPVDVVTRELGGQRGYERSKDDCTLCARTQIVIRHRRK